MWFVMRGCAHTKGVDIIKEFVSDETVIKCVHDKAIQNVIILFTKFRKLYVVLGLGNTKHNTPTNTKCPRRLTCGVYCVFLQ